MGAVIPADLAIARHDHVIDAFLRHAIGADPALDDLDAVKAGDAEAIRRLARLQGRQGHFHGAGRGVAQKHLIEADAVGHGVILGVCREIGAQIGIRRRRDCLWGKPAGAIRSSSERRHRRAGILRKASEPSANYVFVTHRCLATDPRLTCVLQQKELLLRGRSLRGIHCFHSP